MKVFAVVVNWNGGEENLACLESLRVQGLSETSIVFVDNASSDGSLEAVRERFPELLVLRNSSNLGFGAGANLGAERALELGAEAVFFINNDVELPAATLERLLEVCEGDRSLGIVGPRVLYKQDPGRVWCAGGMLTWRQNLSTLLGHGCPDGPRWRENRTVDYLPGCSMLVRREVIERIGLLDADFFAYMEDVDYCLRAAQAGFGVFLVGDSAAHHSTSRSTGGGYNPRRKYMMGVNSIWFLRRHAGWQQWLRFWLFDVASLPLLWFVGLFRGRSRAVLGKARGILDGLRGRRVSADLIREGASWMG